MTPIQAKRQQMVVFLLCLAALAAVVRHFAEPDSMVRTVSTVMMLLWLPVIGSIIGWCYMRLRREPVPTPAQAGFATDQPFAAHALVTLTLRPAAIPAEDRPVPAGDHSCVLVVGHQGFRSRWRLDTGWRRGEPRTLPIEFLSPDTALPHLPVNTAFRLLVGDAFVGDGQIVALLPNADAVPA